MINRKAELLERPWFHGLALTLLLGIANMRMLRPDFFPVHDGAFPYFIFHLFYNEFALFHELPRWLAYGSGGGIQVDWYQALLMSPAQYLVVLLSPLLPFKATVAPYLLSVLIEQAMFVAGSYLLACRLRLRGLTRLFLGVGAVCTILWETQIFNYRNYFWAPLWIYFVDRFLDERRAWQLWTALLLMVLSLVGNAVYNAPVYALLLLALLLGQAGRLSEPRLDWRRWQLLSPRALGALAILTAFCAVYQLFLNHVFDFVTSYAPGRDARTGLASLEVFLTYGKPTPQKFWELLYGAPQDFDFNVTLYVGWIPLALLGAQLATLPLKSGWSRGFWAAAATLSLFSIANLSFVAPLLFETFPLMKLYRHVHCVLPIVKFLLLMLAAIAFEEQLASDPLSKARAEAFRKCGWALIAGVLIIDVFWFKGELPYPIPYPIAYLIPYSQFHFVPMAVLTVLLLRLSSPETLSDASRARWILGCFLVEILSYQFFVTLIAPTRIGPVPPDTFKVRPYAFVQQRMPDRSLTPQAAAAQAFLNRWGTKTSLIDTFLGVDVCDENLRLDLVNRGIDRLIRARVGAPVDDPGAPLPARAMMLPVHFAPVPPGDDIPLQRAFGCAWPRLRLVGKTIVAKDLDDAVRLVRQSPDLESVAVVRSSEGAQRGSEASSQTLGTVSVTEYRANHLAVDADVKARSGAWLVYADGYHPAWSATVNGRRQAVAEVDLGFKGVHLEPGRSLVSLDYGGGANHFLAPLLAFAVAVGCALALLWLPLALRKELNEP